MGDKGLNRILSYPIQKDDLVKLIMSHLRMNTLMESAYTKLSHL